MSDAADFLRRIIHALDAAKIPHMVAGSFASTHHGVPRTTQGLDLIIQPTAAMLRAFGSGLSQAANYVSEEASIDALRRRAMFNVIDMATGWKTDLIV